MCPSALALWRHSVYRCRYAGERPRVGYLLGENVAPQVRGPVNGSE
jgi:hypothetical protein